MLFLRRSEVTLLQVKDTEKVVDLRSCRWFPERPSGAALLTNR